jgi:hypothetical protein
MRKLSIEFSGNRLHQAGQLRIRCPFGYPELAANHRVEEADCSRCERTTLTNRALWTGM